MDGLGNPVYFQLSKGNINDNVLAIDVLSHVNLEGANVLGDKAYGASEIQNYITGKNATYTIPPKINTLKPWSCDWWIYKERHLVECFLINSSILEELLHVMINWQPHIWRLFMLLPSLFCLNNT